MFKNQVLLRLLRIGSLKRASVYSKLWSKGGFQPSWLRFMGGGTSGCQMKTPLSPGQNTAPFFFLLRDKGEIQVARFTLNYTASLRPNEYKSKTSIYRRSVQNRNLCEFSYSSFSSIFLFHYIFYSFYFVFIKFIFIFEN